MLITLSQRAENEVSGTYTVQGIAEPHSELASNPPTPSLLVLLSSVSVGLTS
jgi:hypothetical protein